MSKKHTEEDYIELKKKNEAAEQIIREMFQKVKSLKESVKYWQSVAEEAQDELEEFMEEFVSGPSDDVPDFEEELDDKTALAY